MSTTRGHGLGWNPARSAAAQRELFASGRYCRVSPSPPSYPPAFSLADKRLGPLFQYDSGTCFVHSACQMFATSANALGYPSFMPSRRFVGLVAKAIEGGGNPDDGGDPTDSIVAMTAGPGRGAPHETLWPWTLTEDDDEDRARVLLAQTPPPSVALDAANSRFVSPVVVQSDADAMVLISQGHGVCNGIWWPYGWDAPHAAMETVGPGRYGHSLYEIGYVEPGVWPGHYGRYDWWQFDNWHGLIYPPLPPQFASLVPGYSPITPTATSDFWVRGDLYREVQAMGSFVRVSATDLGGLARNVVVPSAEGVFIL